ncbi:hypothetical protein NP493_1496g00021 [Ridgeia piscesae]|uniref:Rapsyn myristoylation/linker region N-terminal domain-containing protein n=1 Tax=Ridgeia piscesae TaxID=27915 RepID=A0AAD9K0W5_RIDPI|nr:hypothetical protein NP493_1496g00021 [Ridgeia piscesae]
MGQRLARREIEDGLQLYHQQNHEAAIRKWKRALHRISGRRDRFVALGYLAAAHGDCGKYRDMLAYAVQQIDTANETESAAMRAEAYWNLARSNERLCEYHKAVSYARHSLQNEPRDIRLHGYVYLCQANAYFGFSNFVSALENLGRAMNIAKRCGDKPLELHVFASLGHIFTCLKDYEKGLNFHMKAVALAKSFDVCDISWKYDRMTSLNVVTPYRKLGRYEEAMECCEVSLKAFIRCGYR